jgi:predicted permease
MLYKTPVLLLTAIVTMGLGIAAVSFQFIGTNAMLVRGLPGDGGDRLMLLSETVLADGVTGRNPSLLTYFEWREQQSSFEDLAAARIVNVNLADTEDRPERYLGAMVTANVFSEINVRPLMGRAFHDEENSPGAPHTIIIGYLVWQNRYGGDPEIIGRTVRANGTPRTIVGVMPEGFRFPIINDVWIPRTIDRTELTRTGDRSGWVFGRLNENVSRGQAQLQMGTIAERLALLYPESNEGVGVSVQPYKDALLPTELRTIVWVELIAIFGLLFIACANVANLLLARAAVRVKEMAIRTAMGAVRGRVIRLLLIEAVIVGFLGGAAGLVVVAALFDWFFSLMREVPMPYWFEFRIDAVVLTFTFTVSLLAGVAAGLFPALKASGIDVHEMLKDESTGSSSFRMGKFSTGLVVTQIAMSGALLVAAGMMIKSVVNLNRHDMGFETSNILTARLAFSAGAPDSWVQFFNALDLRLEALPGVESAAFVQALPATGAHRSRFAVEGQSYATDRDYPLTNQVLISPGYFDTFGVDIQEGRDFTNQDSDGTLPVVIVNASLAKRYFPRQSAEGQRIRFGQVNTQNTWRTIVAVVPDLYVGEGEIGGMLAGQAIPEQAYVPLAQGYPWGMSLAVKTRGDPLALAPLMRDAVAGLDPDQPMYEVDSMDDVVRKSTWAFKVMGATFSAVGLIALLMSAVGLYGVMAFSVSRRAKEMGIRMALGADSGNLVRLVLRKGVYQIGIGIVLGLALGAALSRPLQMVSFRVSPNDPIVYATVVMTLVLTGLLACLVPALRATRVNVVDALRAE